MVEKKSIEKAPAYVQVYNNLYTDISSGFYQEGETLPSENSLAEHYGVSRSTLRQALAILNEDRLIAKSQGRGTIVTQKNPRFESQLKKAQNPALYLNTKSVSERSITYNYGPPTNIAKEQLALSNSEVVLAVTATYKAEEGPISYAFFQLPVRHFEELGLNIADETVFDELIDHFLFAKATTSRITIKAIGANENDATILNITEGTPLQLLEIILYNYEKQPFSRFKIYLNPAFYGLTIRL